MDAKDLMGFEAFASSVSSSGAVNRWPRLGDAVDVVTYSVYLNGPIAASLPIDLQEQEFKDVLLHALTEKSLLNPNSARDNLKIGELVTIREAWMTSVLNASFSIGENGERIKLSPDIESDYELLSAGFDAHPWIQQQIEDQKLMSLGLTPAMKQAESILGKPVMDRTPDVVSVGKILAQTESFTIQETNAGEVVTHENRRLLELPSVGDDVLVSYYRGQGQVIYNRKDLTISEPYIDKTTNDLAVNLLSLDGSIKETVLFNGIASISKFQQAEGLDQSFVIKAMDLRESHPKEQQKAPSHAKKAVDINIDPESGFFAVDFLQNGRKYTVLFDSLRTIETNASDLEVTPELISKAYSIEHEATKERNFLFKASEMAVLNFIERESLCVQDPNLENGRHKGEVIGATGHHVVQDIGRGTVIVHEKHRLDMVPIVGENITVRYQDNQKGVVSISNPNQSRSIER